MYLKDLISYLEAADQEAVLPIGFTNPHSWRGDYSQLAFEPTENVCVASMLAEARSALGDTFTGWKGGEYTMNEYSEVYLAEQGDTGESIGYLLLDFMCGTVGELERYLPLTRFWRAQNQAEEA